MELREATSRGDETASDVVELVPDLRAEELDVRLRRADRRTEIGHREIAFYLAELHDRGLHQMLGYSTALEYACTRLEMGRRHAQDLIAVGRALNELRAVDEAFCAGRIRWSRVRLLVRIAVPETERAWLDRALTLSWRQFDREVATSERGRPPRQDRRGLPQVKIVVRGRLDRVAYETWELAKRKLEEQRAERMTDAECIAYAGSLILGADQGGDRSGEHVPDSIYRVVIQKCPDCALAAIQTPAGLEEIDAARAACISCDAPSENLEHPDHEDKTPPALRSRILLRDALACRACRSRQELMAHHIVWMSNGGRTKAANLITLCARCHALVHENLLFVSGTAPNGVAFTDRHGIALDAAAPIAGPRIARIRMDAPAYPRLTSSLIAGPEAIGVHLSSRVTLGRVPAAVSHEWWMPRQGLFTWSERAGEMKFAEGEPVEVPAEPEIADGPETDSPPHRPARLADVVGQAPVVHALAIAVKAARARNVPVDHALLLGAAGLGKTTLALALAREIGTRLKCANGAAIRDPGVLIRLLGNLRDRDVLFIDEIHALPRRVMESLYEAMEDCRISLTVTDGHRSRALQVTLPSFTLVGATTEIDRMPEAFLSRFPIREHLIPYEEAEISEIVARTAVRDGVAIDPEAASRIAGAARGGARRAIGLFRRVRNEVLAEGGARIDVGAARRGIEAAGIGADGLSVLEHTALAALQRHGRPMGLARWAACSGLAAATLRRECEPELMRRGLVCVTARGRMARAQLCAGGTGASLCRDRRAWALS